MGKLYMKYSIAIKIFLAMLLLLLLAEPGKERTQPATVDGAVVLTDSLDKVHIDQSIFTVKDPQTAYTIEEVAVPPIQWSFMPNDAGIFNRGFTDSSYWIQFNIVNRSPNDDWLLELPVPMLEQSTLYSPSEDGSFAVNAICRNVPIDEREYYHRNLVFNLDFAAHE